MPKGIDLSIAADTRSAMSAINRGLIDPLEDVSELLEKVGDDGKEAGKDLERGMRDAQRRTDDAADEIRKLRDELNKTGRAGKSSGDDIDAGLGRVKHSAEEAGDELRQNLGETFSSFRGDLEDLPQIAQDVFGGLAGSVDSMVGSLALAGGAAGVGLLIAGFQAIQEQEQQRKERVGEWVQAYIDGLSTMTDAVANFASVEEIYTDGDRYAQAKKNAEDWGVSVSTAVNAMAGDAASLAVVNDTLTASEQRVAEAVDNLKGGRLAGLNKDMRDLRQSTIDGRSSFEALTGEMDEAKAIAAQYSDSLISIAQNAESAQVSVDELGNTVYELPDGQQIMIDAETGQATADLTKFKGDADGVINQINGRDVTLSVNAAVAEAERTVNNFITKNNGKSFTLNGRVKVDSGGWQ